MGSGYGEFRSIYNKFEGIESGLAYAGVEGFNYVQQGDINFSGIVSQTPNIDSMYSIGLNEDGQIVIGFTQNGQTQASTDWSVTVGTLNTDMTVNGLFANTTTTVIGSGLSSWAFGADGSLTLPQGSTIDEATEIVTVTLDQFTDGGYPGTQVFTKVSATLYQILPSGPYIELIGGRWKLKISVSVYYDSLDLITWTALGGGLPTPVGTLGT
jgi:hypothetical protein